MRHIVIRLFLILIGVQFCSGQEAQKLEVSTAGQDLVGEVNAVPGCRALWKEEQKLQKYLRQHPEVLSTSKVNQGLAWNFNVGDTRSWWATNLSTNTEYQVPSTCRAVGTNAYYFVEDSLWNRGRVNQGQVDSIQVAFDSRTPASATKGMFQLDVETYGNPPDVDLDPKIIILILDIKDGFTGSGSYIGGYFFSLNELPDGTQGRRSNVAEIFYLDADPLNLSTASGLATAIRTTAHEFQHMIHWNYDKNELSFVNEGCSEVAEVVVGYPIRSQTDYVNKTDVYLLDWNSTIADYARAARWILYLRDQFPPNYLKLLVQNTNTGILGINSALTQYSPATSRRFDDVFKDWLVANHLNDSSVDPKYAYTYNGVLLKPLAKTFVNPNTGSQTEAVTRLGADYITFNSGSNLTITFNSTLGATSVRAIEVGGSSKRVVDVPIGFPFSEPAFGTTYTSVTFVVSDPSATNDASYTYQATGTLKTQTLVLKYDDNEPVGLLPLSPSDTACVVFDGVPDAKLDSIRVALRRAGSITGGVWTFSGVTRPTPLGNRLAVPVTASISTTPPIPYPVPWPNWSTIDLRSYNIDASAPFVAGFVFGADALTPGIMVTKYPGVDPYHSYTYLHNPSSGTPNWYYLSATGDSVWIYLIRAYVSFTTVGVKEIAELTPSSFSLRQNYPNPFNPTTRIEYQLPVSDHVLLKVYDVLGREVRTLIDESQHAGTYRTEWDGRDNVGHFAVSGVYFYLLKTHSYMQTNKMVLVR